MDDLTEFQIAVLRVVGRSSQRILPNAVGYSLISSGVITPTRGRVKAQGAARMVIKPLAVLSKRGLIRYEWPERERRGYGVTSAGIQLLGLINQQESKP